MIQTNELKRLLEEQGIESTEEQLLQFDRYAELLVEWNKRTTAITEPDEMIQKDSGQRSAAFLCIAPEKCCCD